MESGHFTLPDQKNYEYAYQLAYKLACERLASISDIKEQCHRVDAAYRIVDSKAEITIKYLNRSYLVTLPDIKISLKDSDEEVPLRDQVLLLHYLSLGKGTPLANKQVTFRELPAGGTYFPTFSKRAIKPLVDYFGKEPQLLITAAEKVGGCKADYGDAGVTINVFSRVPVTPVLWRGDDEFPAEGSILFDATIPDYLATEDVTVLCQTLAWQLVGYLKERLRKGQTDK